MTGFALAPISETLSICCCCAACCRKQETVGVVGTKNRVGPHRSCVCDLTRQQSIANSTGPIATSFSAAKRRPLRHTAVRYLSGGRGVLISVLAQPAFSHSRVLLSGAGREGEQPRSGDAYSSTPRLFPVSRVWFQLCMALDSPARHRSASRREKWVGDSRNHLKIDDSTGCLCLVFFFGSAVRSALFIATESRERETEKVMMLKAIIAITRINIIVAIIIVIITCLVVLLDYSCSIMVSHSIFPRSPRWWAFP